MSVLREVTLYKTEGSSDKVYGLSIEPAEGANAIVSSGLFNLFYMNGRRGSTMRKNLKLNDPVTLEVANREFDKVLKAKTKDGYTEAQSGVAYTNTDNAGRVCGYKPMLPADLPKTQPEIALDKLLNDDTWGLQEKMDGENRILIIKDGVVQGANKSGLFVPIPEVWSGFAALGDCVLFGEQIGDQYYVFDMHSSRQENFVERFHKLTNALEMLSPENPSTGFMSLVDVTIGKENKRHRLAQIDGQKGEGVVFKNLHAKFEPGKNDNSIRYKLYESMTCFVTEVNAQRSVAVGAFSNVNDMGSPCMVPLGNVTIPANHDVPPINALVEVRYLYRFEDGALMQPVFKGLRNDVAVDTVTTDQITRIKRKGQPVDLDDESLSTQALADLAISEIEENLHQLRFFMPAQQANAIRDLVKKNSSESLQLANLVQAMTVRIGKMPKTGETEGAGDSAVLQISYGGQDEDGRGLHCLVIEKDVGSALDENPGEQLQAYGIVVSSANNNGYEPEFSYINIADLIEAGYQLDLKFEPITVDQFKSELPDHAQTDKEVCA